MTMYVLHWTGVKIDGKDVHACMIQLMEKICIKNMGVAQFEKKKLNYGSS